MHFRHFIIMGVLLGVSTFLPNNVFAEKNGPNGQPEPQNSAVQAFVSEKTENVKAAEKTIPITPQPVNKNQGGVVQNPVSITNSHQTVPIKPNTKPLETVNDKAQSSLEKNVKAGIAAEPAAKEKHIGPSGQGGNTNAVTDQLPKVSTLPSLHKADSGAKPQHQPLSQKTKSKTFGKETYSPITIETDYSQTWTVKPPIEKGNKAPSNHKKFPEDIQIMNSPPQRTQSGGQSNDQLNQGAGMISFIANWYDWDDHFNMNLSQIYPSLLAKYCNQWMNAPPSPPPKEAPFFLTFTADLSHR